MHNHHISTRETFCWLATLFSFSISFPQSHNFQLSFLFHSRFDHPSHTKIPSNTPFCRKREENLNLLSTTIRLRLHCKLHRSKYDAQSSLAIHQRWKSSHVQQCHRLSISALSSPLYDPSSDSRYPAFLSVESVSSLKGGDIVFSWVWYSVGIKPSITYRYLSMATIQAPMAATGLLP